jgi:hypothetical protein
MQDSRKLKVKIAEYRDFSALIHVLMVLVLLACMLSPQPVLLSAIALLVFGGNWTPLANYFFRLNDRQLTLVIYSDGRVKLSSACKNVAEGNLYGQQWCTQHLIVLKISAAGGTQYLPILPRQQAVDEYRRLNVWLRQGICN